MKIGGLFQPTPGDKFIVNGREQIWLCVCIKNGVFAANITNLDDRICFDYSAPFHRVLEEK